MIESSKERHEKTSLAQHATKKCERLVKEIRVVVSCQRNKGRNCFKIAVTHSEFHHETMYDIIIFTKDRWFGILRVILFLIMPIHKLTTIVL